MDSDRIPRDPDDDYTEAAAAFRREFAAARTGAGLEHVGSYSIDPAATAGNIENLIGAAQVPIGLAGPVLVDGEHAQGEFYVPLATTEGTLVASYNRGMKLVREAGGAKTTILDDRMQRAPSFVFPSAREARDFGTWLTANFEQVAAEAAKTTSSGQLVEIQQFPVGRILYTRFNYTTGDAAGQNMTGKATAFACKWILANYDGVEDFFLESNLATDKKTSTMNMLHTRGKRVVAEAVIPNELVQEHMRTNTGQMFKARQLATLGGFMSGVNNTGSHSANGITAMFIATGQDAANVAESSAAYVYVELRPNGDYYYSITLPALIVATYGGGTGLPTQRECLELMDCYGSGKVRKFAEIVAATVLCGEISLGSAIVADEWVKAHDDLGRNR
jgi:hydroxymethylglutaryl-CoA reductase (NADPH)